MKKLKGLLLILIAIFLVGCNAPTSVSYANSSITIEVGEYYNVNESKINVVGSSKYTLNYSIDNINIASINSSTIKGESIGKTTLHIFARSGINQVETTVEIVVIPKVIRADSVRVANSAITLNLQNGYTFNKITTTNNQSKTVNEVPQISIVPKIIEYDYVTGKVTGINTGNAVVTINYTKCSTSFTVEVYNHIYLTSFVCSDISQNNTITMFKGESGKLNYSFTPANGNTFEFTTTATNITLTKDGYFETLDTGSASVTLKYKTSKNTTITQEFTINVIDKLNTLSIIVLSNPNSSDNMPLYNTTVDKNVAVKEKDYLLKVTPDIDIDINKITWSSGITIKSDWVKSGKEYKATIEFSSTTDTFISATYKNTVYNVKNEVVSNTYSVQVYTIHNLVTEVRSNLISIGGTQATYTIYKKPYYIENLTSAMTYIDFAFYLDENKQIPYLDNVKSYVGKLELSGNLFHSKDFDLNTTGYTVTIKALDIEIDSLIVKVLEPDIALRVNYEKDITFVSGDSTITIGLEIENNFDSNNYQINPNLLSLVCDSTLIDNHTISIDGNSITINSYIDSLNIDIYYNETLVKSVSVSITQ